MIHNSSPSEKKGPAADAYKTTFSLTAWDLRCKIQQIEPPVPPHLPLSLPPFSIAFHHHPPLCLSLSVFAPSLSPRISTSTRILSCCQYPSWGGGLPCICSLAAMEVSALPPHSLPPSPPSFPSFPVFLTLSFHTPGMT